MARNPLTAGQNLGDVANVADVADLQNRVGRHPIPDDPVIFFGSSSFRLWDPTIRTDLDSSAILNLAFGGSTLESCGEYFERIMAPFRAAKSMVVYAGDNDLGQGRSAGEVRDGLMALLSKIENWFGPISVFFVSIKPSPSKQSIFETIVESNRLIERESVGRENLYYIDIFSPMLHASGQSDPVYFLEDMLHMNQAGYDVWRRVILKHREQIGL